MCAAQPALLATQVIGSYPQPEWLIDREALSARLPPRIRMTQLWRVEERFLEQALDDATTVAVRAMEAAGIDTITDGEVRRESYSNFFANALEGVDLDNPGEVLDRSGAPNEAPRITGPVRRAEPVNVRDVEFLRSITDRRISITVPGPFTMTQQAYDDHYGDPAELARAYAVAVNEELLDLQAAGADVIQIDEPYLQARAEAAGEYALEVIERAFQGVTVTKALHTCFGYAQVIHAKPEAYPFLAELNSCAADVIAIEAAQPGLDPARLADLPDKQVAYGVLDLGDQTVETPEVVADRIRAALEHIDAERLIPAPDCGMKYMARDVANAKLKALVDGAAIVRAELGG